MLWLETKSVVATNGEMQGVMFKQFGDSSCNGNRSIVSSITYVPILVITDRYYDSLHGIVWHFSMH